MLFKPFPRKGRAAPSGVDGSHRLGAASRSPGDVDVGVVSSLRYLPERPLVALLGNYGTQNLGTEATLAATTQLLRRGLQGVELLAISDDPADTENRHGIPAVPATRAVATLARDRGRAERESGQEQLSERSLLAGRMRRSPVLRRPGRAVLRIARSTIATIRDPLFEVRCERHLRGASLLVINGGGQLSDHFGGVAGFPFVLLKWSVLARLAGARVVVARAGAGPLRSPLSRLLVRLVIDLADYRSFRDPASRELIASLRVRGELHTAPDSVFALETDAFRAPDRSCRVVGFNPFPFRDERYWPTSEPRRYRDYLETIAAFARRLVENGHTVVLLPTQIRADARVLDDLEALLREDGSQSLPARIERPRVHTLEQLIAQIGRVDVFVATRFHAILLGFLTGRPVLGLANEEKMVELMRWLGQAEHCLSLEELDLEHLTAAFDGLRSEAVAVAAAVRSRAAECRELVERDCENALAVALGTLPARVPRAQPAGARAGS